MGIIRRTFTFWLVAGIIAALAITVVIPWIKTKTTADIPGTAEAEKLIEQAKTAIAKLPENPLKTVVIKKAEPVAQPPQVSEEESLKTRDEKLFQRQCSILDDLM